MNKRNVVLGAALAGIIAAGSIMTSSTAMAGDDAHAEKNSCKGKDGKDADKNSCKGKAAHAGKDKNSCKGKNGCGSKTDEKAAAPESK